MSLADAIVSLAVLVKKLSDDATENVGLCQTLGNRVELIPRLLEQFPHIAELDDKFLMTLFGALKDCRDVITEYGRKGKFGRFFQSSAIKKKFNDLDALIGQCVDDLTLSVGINSSNKIDELGNLVTTTLNTLKLSTGQVEEEEEKENLNDLFLLNYNDIQFSIKRGIRKELKVSSSSQARLYLAKYKDEDVVVREPTYEVSDGVAEKWQARVVEMGSFMRDMQKFPTCFAHIYGGGVEYLDDDEESPEMVQQLFVILKYYPESSLLDYVASANWDLADIQRTLSHVYRITFAAFMAYANPQTINESGSALLSAETIMLSHQLEPLVSLAHLFQYESLTLSGGGVTEGSIHFESIPIQALRWYTPEDVKTDQQSGDVTSSSAKDAYIIGLLCCYMLTGHLPYHSLLSAVDKQGNMNNTYSLLEGMRSGQQVPYDVASVNSNPSLLHLLNLCLHKNPKSRPSLMFILTSLKTISLEMKISLPFDISAYELPTTPNDNPDASDSESESGLMDFDYMTSKVENISNTVKLFRSSIVTDMSRVPYVVVFGNKVILLHFNLSQDLSAQVTNAYDEEDEEDHEEGLIGAVNVKSSGNGTTGTTRGIVIFHIDNTTSMKREKRNQLTKEVLLRVIPDLLRKNFRVIVNSWACDAATMGKIQSRDVSASAELLEPDKKVELAQHIQNIVCEILEPSGKTDLYGSLYQLFDQCDSLHQGNGNDGKSAIFCFVLTDGNHNHFAYPIHSPSCVDEDYFGVYKAQLIKNKLKFGLSGKPIDIPYAQSFLAQKFGISSGNNHVSLTLIGIGEAGTSPLSALATVLGEQCSFVGITEISQADCVFSNIDNFSGAANGQLSVVFSRIGKDKGNKSDVVEEFQYVLGAEDNSYVSGCLTILDVVKSDVVVNHCDTAVVSNAETSVSFAEEPLHFDDKSVISEGSKYQRFSYSLEELVETVLPLLAQIRHNSYDVTAETFQALFTQLLRDKKQLWLVKTALFAKKTRHFRQNPVFVAFTIWLKELEYLIDSQISSYRVNVEDELFASLESSAAASVSGGAAGGGGTASVQPAAIVLERLKNNLQNTGRKVHQVHRHVAAISSIRDRTLNLGTTLLSSELSLTAAADASGVVLNVNKKNGKHYSVSWSVDKTGDKCISLLQHYLETVDISQVHHNVGTRSSLSAVQLSFPCFLIQSFFDPLTVIRASELITFHDICCDLTSKPLQFCAEEIWDLCSSSNHVVGEVLPVVEAVQQIMARLDEQSTVEIDMDEVKEDRKVAYNMILPVATTPLLMSLYCERGRLYQNGINLTGDVLAMTAATGQWAKVLHDIFITLPKHRDHPIKAKSLVGVALQCLVSYSYAIDFSMVAPSKNSVEVLFPTDSNVPPVGVMARDGMSGLTCPLGVAMLAAYVPKSPFSGPSQVYAWNTILVTIFSRLCEAISGQKNIRFSNGRSDPSELETPFRLLVGELQSTLKRRLHLEWTNSSQEDKLAIIATNASAVKDCLLKVVTQFINELHVYNLPTFASAIYMMSLAMVAKNYGTDRLRDFYIKCEEDTSDVVDMIIAQNSLNMEAFALPVFYVASDDNARVTLALRELEDGDHDHMLAYIDAIVATKVSPKIVYQPVVNPSYPSFSASQNQSLQFQKNKTNWDIDLPVANICLIGNVNSGKSSIGGQLLSHLNIVSDKALQKMEHMAKKLGRTENLQYAWVMDNLREERAGGFTVKPKYNGFQTSTRRFNMIDNPGHNDYAVNYATGIYHADVVLLVVSAVASEQHLAEVTRSMVEEHLVTAFCFGIKQVMVLVNKMDLVDYSEQAFLETKTKTMKYLKKAGFKVTDENMFIPISALEGDGFLSIPSHLSWYDGPCLLQALDYVPLPKRVENKAFRMVLDEVFKVSGVGNVLCGKVERGMIRVHDKVNIYPSGTEQVTVKSIESHGHAVECAKPGDDIGIAVSMPANNGRNKAIPKFRRGMILGLSSEAAVPVMTRFEVQLFIVGKNVTMKVGGAPTILTHLCAMQVKITRLIETLGKNNAVLSRDPAMVRTGDTCIMEVEARQPISAETIHDCPKLSRFVIQSNRMTVAIGFIRARLS